MRDELRKHVGKKIYVTCKVDEISVKHDDNSTSVCLVDLRFGDGRPLCDHMWVQFGKITFDVGDTIGVRGIVAKYKRVKQHVVSFDYGLKGCKSEKGGKNGNKKSLGSSQL